MIRRVLPIRIMKLPPVVAAAWLILLFMILLAMFGASLAAVPFDQFDIQNAMLPPGSSFEHPLGTDFLGRDVFSRLLSSIRVTLLISVVGTVISAALGSTLGVLAGDRRGIFEDIVMTAVDVQASLPFIVFALTALALLGNSFVSLLLVIGINGWENYARLARGMVLSVKEREYVLAAKSLGIQQHAVYLRHILPNIASPLVVEFGFNLAGTILLESSLSFLGLGVQLPMTSLGQMMGDGRDYLLFAPWLSLIPGTAIFLIVISVSLVGDWLRDALDPR